MCCQVSVNIHTNTREGAREQLDGGDVLPGQQMA